jgi:uncharacterized protein with HEPN domain
MSDARVSDYLNDILEAASRIATYTEAMTFDQFLTDFKTQDAVIRNLEIIGEATKQVPDRVRQIAPHIPWKSIAGMRDKLIHQYFGVNLDIVWNVGRGDLSALVKAVETILSELNIKD